jgi:hypothetical protein
MAYSKSPGWTPKDANFLMKKLLHKKMAKADTERPQSDVSLGVNLQSGHDSGGESPISPLLPAGPLDRF